MTVCMSVCSARRRAPTWPESIAHRNFMPIDPVADDAPVEYAWRFRSLAAAQKGLSIGIRTDMRREQLPEFINRPGGIGCALYQDPGDRADMAHQFLLRATHLIGRDLAIAAHRRIRGVTTCRRIRGITAR